MKYKTAIIDVDIDVKSFNKYEGSVSFYMVHATSVVRLYNHDIVNTLYSHGGYCLDYFFLGANRTVDCFILINKDISGKGNIDDLVMALEWCVESNVNLISMSIGTTHYIDSAKLFIVVNHIVKKGICLIASADNNGCITYPACFDGCIGVQVEVASLLAQTPYAFIPNSFNGINIFINPNTLKGDVIRSNSFATAYFSGYLSISLTTEHINLEHIKKWLTAEFGHHESQKALIHSVKSILPPCEENVIIIAVQNLCKTNLEKFCSKLQDLFITSDYFCVTVYTNKTEDTTINTEFASFKHLFHEYYGCSYAEFVDLIIRMCCPSIVLVDYAAYNECGSSKEVDVILYTQDNLVDSSNILMLNIKEDCNVNSIYNKIINYYE